MRGAYTEISAFCETGSGTTPPRSQASRYYNGGIPWVKSGELREKVILETEETVSEQALEETSLKLIPAGAVLVAMYGATVGRVGLLGIPATTNQAVCHVVPDPEVADTTYVYHALQAKLPEFISRSVGGAQPNISQKIVREAKIYLPQLPEQKRIAAILDKADAIRRKRRQALTEIDTLLRATFLDMFGDPRTNPKGLRSEPLGQLIKVKSGEFLPAREMHADGTIPVYGGNGISGYHSKALFNEPRIVIGRVGVYCGAVHVTEAASWVTDNALYVSEMSCDLTFDYLAAALRFANLNQYANQAAQPLISGSRIYPVEILVPTETGQLAFGRARKAVAALCARGQLLGEESEDLFGSLSQRAFRGEL